MKSTDTKRYEFFLKPPPPKRAPLRINTIHVAPASEANKSKWRYNGMFPEIQITFVDDDVKPSAKQKAPELKDIGNKI